MSLTLDAETIHDLSKRVAKRLEENENTGERKLKTIMCEIHERRMRPDRKRDAGEYQIVIEPGDGVYLDIFTTCAHSKVPCRGRASIPIARFVTKQDGTTDTVFTDIDNLDVTAK